MTPRRFPPLSRQIHSDVALWLIAVATSLAVFSVAVFLQWLIYDDWLHDKGLRLTGSVLGAIITLIVTYRWQVVIRERKRELLARLETIKWMNDRIRNSLQAIECITFASAPEATEAVRESVDTIEAVLHEVLLEAHPGTARKANPSEANSSVRDAVLREGDG